MLIPFNICVENSLTCDVSPRNRERVYQEKCTDLDTGTFYFTVVQFSIRFRFALIDIKFLDFVRYRRIRFEMIPHWAFGI